MYKMNQLMKSLGVKSTKGFTLNGEEFRVQDALANVKVEYITGCCGESETSNAPAEEAYCKSCDNRTNYVAAIDGEVLELQGEPIFYL